MSALHLFLLSLACSPSRTTDTTSADEISDPGWEEGTVQPCDAPLPAVSYTDASASWGAAETWKGRLSEGALAVEQQQEQWRLWQLAPPQQVGFWTEDAEPTYMADEGITPTRFLLNDFDDDGESDLLVHGEYLQLIWSAGTDPQSTILIEFTAFMGVRTAGAIDADGDGDRDIYVLIAIGGEDGEQQDSYGLLLENLGDRSFAEPVYLAEGEPSWGASFDALVLDWDGDADPDLYICNDFGSTYGPNWVLLNDGAGGFTKGDDLGAGITAACMGTSAADMDTDGDLDLYLPSTAEHFLLQSTDAGYVDVTAAWGLPDGAYKLQMLWGAQLADYDNDGMTDIFVSTSQFSLEDAQPFPLWLLRQDAPGSFVEAGAALGLPQETMSRTAVALDINGDGVLDLLASDAARTAWVLLSDGCTAENWIEVEAPSGTTVIVEADGVRRAMLVTTEPGMGASVPPVAHIGLGASEQVDRITAHLPWLGERTLIGPIPARQRVRWAGD